MRKIATIFIISMLLCNLVYAKTKHVKKDKKHNLEDKYSFYEKTINKKNKHYREKWLSAEKDAWKGQDKNNRNYKSRNEKKKETKKAAYKESEDLKEGTAQSKEKELTPTPEHKEFDKSMASLKAKSNNVGQNTNTVNNQPQATLSTSFNHTDAILNINRAVGHCTFGGYWQQKVTGTDSIASLMNLNGIESGSIIKLKFQYTAYKLAKTKTNTTSTISLAPGFFTNGQFTYNPASNKYTTDSVTLKQITANNINISGKIVAGYHFEPSDVFGMSLSVGYENGTSYTANQATSFYTSFGKSSNYYTTSESFGKPKYQNISVLSVELIGALINVDKTENADTVKGYSFAFDLDAGYSFTLNKYAIQMPIYFIKGTEDKVTALNGGVILGYSWAPTNWTQPPAVTGFTAQIFISTPFNFFNGSLGQ